MSTPHHEPQDYAQLDEAIGHSTHKLFNMSPNDVLVQISLPVILILAIATRLITIGQGLTQQQASTPAVLDLWKQHLILRVDRTLERWEKDSGLPQFTDFGRVYWKNHWPADERFQQLCAKASALADLEKLQDTLYRESLGSQPSSNPTDRAGANWSVALYDPLYAPPGTTASSVPPDFRIDDGRRQYALEYIKERCQRWRREIEELQWKMIERLAAELPATDPLTSAQLATQMKNIAAALAERGYPLLPGISHEYRKEP